MTLYTQVVDKIDRFWVLFQSEKLIAAVISTHF